MAGQINEITQALGILLLLPHILSEYERIEAISLGAGNSGRPFDLQTNRRIAEFKFISWKGGAETIRQNSIFKDYYYLAEAETPKERYLYVIDTKYPLKFFNSKRALKSVMSKNSKLTQDFRNQYGEAFSKVSEYYHHFAENHVHIEDVAKYIPNFSQMFATIAPDENPNGLF